MSFFIPVQQGYCYFRTLAMHHQSNEVDQESESSIPQIDADQAFQDPVDVIISNWLARRNDTEANEIIELWSRLLQENCSMKSPSFEQVFKLTYSLLDEDGMNEFQFTTLTKKISEFEYVEPNLIKALCNAIERRINQDAPYHLKNLIVILWAFADFGVNDRTLLDLLIRKIKEYLDTDNNISGEELGYIFCALAKIGYNHVPFVNCLNKHIQSKLDVFDFFSGKDLANIAWAYAELRRRNVECIVSLKDIIDRNLENPEFFIASDAICIAWAFMVFEIDDCHDSITKLLSIIELGINVQDVTSRERQLLLELYELLLLSNVDVSQYVQLCELVDQTKMAKRKNEVHNEEFSECVKRIINSVNFRKKNGVLEHSISDPTLMVGQSIALPVYMKIAAKKSSKSKTADLNFVIEISPPQCFLVNPEEESHPPRRSYRGRTLAHPDRFMYLPKPNTKQCLLKRAGWKYASIPHFKWDHRDSVQRNSYIAGLISTIIKKVKSEITSPIQHNPEMLGQQFQRLSLEVKEDEEDALAT